MTKADNSIEVQSIRSSTEPVDGSRDVLARLRPTAPVAHSAVLDVEHRVAATHQVSGQRAPELSAVARRPVAAVDDHDYRRLL